MSNIKSNKVQKSTNDNTNSLDLLTLEEIEAMSMSDTLANFSRYINPHLAKAFSLLGLAKRKPVSALGCIIKMDDKSEVLDMTGGLAILNVGHNHPRIIEARAKWAMKNGLEVWKFIPSPYHAGLAENLGRILPGDLELAFFCNSGAEANEGAMKLASKYAGKNRDLIVYTDISFHGKTHATLSVSGSENPKNSPFKTMSGCLEIPYGDSNALREMILEHKKQFQKSRVSTFIVEAIRSEGVICPPETYMQEVRKICDDYDVTLICDEVFCGFGRTGQFFAFNHSGITPDIVTISKAFGAGKATFAAYITKPSIFKKAYGSMEEATLHSTTYNGFAEELITAIEGINIIYDEKLVEKSRENGNYLLSELEKLKLIHPSILKEVKGIGLLVCIKTENIASKALNFIPAVGNTKSMLKKITTAGIISKLYEDYDILTFTPLHDPSQILLAPPLVITKREIDRFISALSEVLNSNFLEHGAHLVKNSMATR